MQQLSQDITASKQQQQLLLLLPATCPSSTSSKLLLYIIQHLASTQTPLGIKKIPLLQTQFLSET
jgi:hypothetical protein